MRNFIFRSDEETNEQQNDPIRVLFSGKIWQPDVDFLSVQYFIISFQHQILSITVIFYSENEFLNKSLSLLPAYSRKGRGILALRHYVLHFYTKFETLLVEWRYSTPFVLLL